MRIFLAGIMQGSRQSASLYPQDYRERLTKILNEHFPDVEVYDPFANHPTSLHYTDEEGKKVFLGHNALCGEMDVIIAFLPEASMGTAIEIWEGWKHGAVVVTVSPMTSNWVVRFLGTRNYETLEELEGAIRDGSLRDVVLRSCCK
ncbi:MAG: hypothetical protein Q4D98_02475 [Planctomycetia bacterium]|nr:hypothetical protein [Planctomycetia bacterium]